MVSKFFFVAAFLFINGVVSLDLFLETPCKADDNECTDRVVSKATEVIITGDSHYLDSIDPFQFDIVQGDLTIIDYSLKNTTITGLKSCKILNVKTNWANLKLNLELECPADISIVGNFFINGRIFSGPITGNGDFEFTLDSFKVNMDAKLSKKIRSDHNFGLAIKSFIANAQVKTPTKAIFSNLVTSDRSKFTPLTWRAFGDVMQEPVLYATCKKMLNNLNLSLKQESFENPIAKNL